MPRVEVYLDISGEWRWRTVADNGQVTASSGEAFASKSNAQRAAANIFPDHTLVVIEPTSEDRET